VIGSGAAARLRACVIGTKAQPLAGALASRDKNCAGTDVSSGWSPHQFSSHDQAGSRVPEHLGPQGKHKLMGDTVLPMKSGESTSSGHQPWVRGSGRIGPMRLTRRALRAPVVGRFSGPAPGGAPINIVLKMELLAAVSTHSRRGGRNGAAHLPATPMDLAMRAFSR